MSISKSRKTAVNILISIEKDGAYSNISVAKEFLCSELSNADKALASAIVYGTLDRKITIDYIISRYIKTPVNKIKPITLTAIRIALYQIIYLDKIPESAAVNESVNIVKASKEKYNASFVNGVLRAYLREPAEIPSGNDIKSLSVRYSCPVTIIESFVSDYGTETAVLLLEESLKKPPITARVNNLKTDTDSLIKILDGEKVTAKKSTLDNSIEILSGIDVANSKAYKEGLFHIEDMASQIAISKIGLRNGLRVLDICAAPGGKSFTMAEIMNNTGEVVSLDLYKHRVDLIKKGAQRLGIGIINARISDATVYNETLGQFDVVLCDVPCSGLGVIRRKPEIKYKDITKNDFDELCDIQMKILHNASKYVKIGGKLVYSTCTLKNAENKAQINAFLDKTGDFELQCSNEFMPHIDKTDGFYCAVLVRNG